MSEDSKVVLLVYVGSRGCRDMTQRLLHGLADDAIGHHVRVVGDNDQLVQSVPQALLELAVPSRRLISLLPSCRTGMCRAGGYPKFWHVAQFAHGYVQRSVHRAERGGGVLFYCSSASPCISFWSIGISF